MKIYWFMYYDWNHNGTTKKNDDDDINISCFVLLKIKIKINTSCSSRDQFHKTSYDMIIESSISILIIVNL